MMEINGGSSNQMVDFLVELIPQVSPKNRQIEELCQGTAHRTLDKVYVEFHLAVNEVPTYVTVSRYSTTIKRKNKIALSSEASAF